MDTFLHDVAAWMELHAKLSEGTWHLSTPVLCSCQLEGKVCERCRRECNRWDHVSMVELHSPEGCQHRVYLCMACVVEAVGGAPSPEPSSELIAQINAETDRLTEKYGPDWGRGASAGLSR